MTLPLWETDYEAGFEEAKRRVKAVAERKGTQISFSGLRLNRLPTEISNLTYLKNLEIYGCEISDFTSISNLTNLELLKIGSLKYEFFGLAFASKLKNLTFLSIHSKTDFDLKPIQHNLHLERLFLNGTKSHAIEIHGLEHILPLKKLQIISFCNVNAKTFKYLGQLSTLKSIGLIDSNLSNLKGFENLRELKHLSINNSQVTDLRPLGSLYKLEYLDIKDTKVTDLRPLSSLYKLEYLNIKDTKVADLRPIIYLSSLRELDISSTPIKDLSPIKILSDNTSKLERLDISNTEIVDLDPLISAESLRSLNASNTKITSVAACAHMRALSSLVINNTNIITLGKTGSLSKLIFLYASGTKITNLKALKGAKSLQGVLIEGTEVTNIYPIKGNKLCNELNLRNSKVLDLSPIASIGGDYLIRPSSMHLDFRDTPASISSDKMKYLANLIEESADECFIETKRFFGGEYPKAYIKPSNSKPQINEKPKQTDIREVSRTAKILSTLGIAVFVISIIYLLVTAIF